MISPFLFAAIKLHNHSGSVVCDRRKHAKFCTSIVFHRWNCTIFFFTSFLQFLLLFLKKETTSSPVALKLNMTLRFDRVIFERSKKQRVDDALSFEGAKLYILNRLTDRRAGTKESNTGVRAQV